MFSLSEDPAQVLYYLPEKFYHFVHEYYTHTSLRNQVYTWQQTPLSLTPLIGRQVPGAETAPADLTGGYSREKLITKYLIGGKCQLA